MSHNFPIESRPVDSKYLDDLEKTTEVTGKPPCAFEIVLTHRLETVSKSFMEPSLLAEAKILPMDEQQTLRMPALCSSGSVEGMKQRMVCMS